MQREIKFRFWSTAIASMSPSVTLSGLASSPTFRATDGDMTGLRPMQYTGLKDKNGVEIYEGDIVDYWMPSGGKLYRVKTHRRAVQWTCASQHNGWNVTGGRNQMSWEVIGNVYENPDLLQEATR